MSLPSRTRSLGIAALLAIAMILAVTEWLVPALIRAAYAGHSIGFLNDLIRGQERHPVDDYVSSWRAIGRPAAAILIFLASLGGVSRAVPRDRNPIRRLIGGPGELSSRHVLLQAAWFGALGGVLEAGVFTAVHLATGTVADSYDAAVLWLGPLSAMLAFVLAGAALALFARLAAARWSPAALSLPLAFTAALSAAQAPNVGIHWAATLLVAAGFAAVVWRTVRARTAGFLRLVRRTSIGLGASFVVAGAIGLARAHAGPPVPGPPASGGQASVLFLLLDTVRASNTSLHGYERHTTPEIAEWAGRGVTFEHAISTASWTLPSHATMFTGLYNASLKTGPTHRLGAGPATLAEVLSGLGYRTGGFVANFFNTTRTSGLQRGYQTYETRVMDVSRFAWSSWSGRWVSRLFRALTGVPEPPGPKSAEMVRREFLDWLDESPKTPFFAFLNFFDAHSPYVSPVEFGSRFGPPEIGAPPPGLHDAEELRGRLNAYDGAIAYVDHQIGLIRDALERRGLLDNTLVIITADHGEQWGEHGLTEHANSLYLPTLHVPLVLVLPGSLPSGLRVTQVVSVRDIPATVLDLVGLGREHEIPGISLVGSIERPGSGRSPALSEIDHWSDMNEWEPASRGDMRSLVEWPYHYIRIAEGEETLFDIERDPGEELDLLATMPELGRAMRARMDSILARAANND